MDNVGGNFNQISLDITMSVMVIHIPCSDVLECLSATSLLNHVQHQKARYSLSGDYTVS